MPDPTENTATPVAPEIQAPAPSAPDLSAVTGPAPAAPDLATAVQTVGAAGAAAPYQQAEADATKKATDLASQPIASSTPPPHARLLAMISGLALGLDSFGKSIATQGKEGGATEVQQVRAQQQEQKLQQQQADQALRNSQIQQQLTIADTNHKLASNMILLATLPTDLKLKDLELSKGQQDLAAGKAALANTKAEFMTNYGMTPDQFDSMMSGNTAPDQKTAQQLQSFSQQKVDAAAKILPADDPYVQKAQEVLKNPNATPQEIFSAVASVNRQVGLNKEVTAAKTAAEAAAANSPIGKLSTPEALAQPGSQAAIQAKIDDPKTDPADIPRLKQLIPLAGIAQAHAQRLDYLKALSTKNAELAASAGDPKVAGKMLHDGTLTLADLKSRGSTPKQITDAVAAAQSYGPYNASDEITGERVMGGQTNQTFFGSARSLVQQGGMLDQLKAAHDALGTQKIPAFNTIEQWLTFNAGSPEMAAFKQAVLGAADDYAKVMGGGNPNLEQFKQLEDSFAAKLNDPQFESAIKVGRSAVRSQITGRIGTNRYVMQREGDILQDEPTVAPIPKFQPDAQQPTRPANVPANQIHGNGPHGMGWYDPQIFGSK